jgi:hypothetical protein
MSADCLSDKLDKNGFYGPESDRFVIYGTTGDIMWVFFKINEYPFTFSFQTPGTLHEVYMPTPSITRGGHFYTYDSLHLI